jgi:general secretion pathway protein D
MMLSRIFPALCLGIFLAVSASRTAAQEGIPPEQQVPPSRLEPRPAPPGSVPPANPLPANLPPQGNTSEETVGLQFPNVPVDEVINYYELLTNKIVIRDANLAGSPVTIVVRDEVPKSQAIEVIESVLLLNGYVFVDAGPGKVKILNTSSGKNPRSEAVPLYTSLTDLPSTEQVVSFFLPLTYLSTEEALPIFQSHFVIDPQYGQIVPVPNAQALVLTENTPVIREMIKLRDLIDVPPARVATEFVQLRRANAERVAEAITQIIEARRQNRPNATTGAAVSVNNAPPPPQQGEGGQGQSTQVVVQTTATADAERGRHADPGGSTHKPHPDRHPALKSSILQATHPRIRRRRGADGTV